MATAYELIDSGNEKKYERFGAYRIVRPCPQALWRPQKKWECDAEFTRADGWKGSLPTSWEIPIADVRMKLSPTDFGHLGLFPEHAIHIEWLKKQKPKQVLNLFAYSGLLSLALARDAQVCHLDASKGMIQWGKENAALNGIDSIRWIVDDAIKFLKREVKRGQQYDMIILDPPTFGRGSKGEVFKIERDIVPLLDLCHQLAPSSILLSCHTPGVTPRVLVKLLYTKDAGEALLGGDIPCGAYARWVK